ncbi:MAG: PilW family protein [Oceanococcus sp.]
MNQNLRKQSGLSLVELMVALVLSTVVIAGVVQIFLSGQQSYRLQRGLGMVQDNGRLAVFFLQRGLRQAGIPRQSGFTGAGLWQLKSPMVFVSLPDASTNPATRDGDNPTDPDFVTIMYQSATNCLGQQTNGYPVAQRMEIPAGSGNFFARDQYFIGPSRAGAVSADNPLSLRCRSLGSDNLQVGGSSLALVDGIDNLQIVYGLDTFNDATAQPSAGGNGDFRSDVYLNATAVTARNLWGSVVSVRYSVLATSIDNGLESGINQQHRLLDDVVHPAVNDRLLRKVFRSSLEIRNRTP